MTDFSIYHSGWYLFVRRHWLTVVFLLGFVTDYILLNRIDDTFDNAILLFYVVLASISILLFYVGVAEKISLKWSQRLRHYMPVLMQYSFGGLLSGMLIFYGRSGDLLVSYPFIILIIGVIIINEMVSKQSDRLLYNLAVYFIGVFSYCVLVMPVIVNDMGDLIFVGSGVLAVIIMVLMIKILSKIIPNFMATQQRGLTFIMGCIYVLFNVFYFLNIIPPIPLSLTELSIYQSVQPTNSGGYRITKEDSNWFDVTTLLSDEFHPLQGQGVSCFARVYAPTNLTTNIVHRWEFLDSSGDWKEHYVQSYKITGENKKGYRGYTTIKSIHDGKWRCSVESERGQVLGRLTFTIDTTQSPKDLVTVVE